MLVLSPRYLVNSRGPIDAPVNLHVNRWTNVCSSFSSFEIGNRWKFLSSVCVCVCENDTWHTWLIIYDGDKDVYCGVYLHWRD